MPGALPFRNFRFAARAFAKSPGFTAAAVLALALGIGANTAIFSVVNAVFLRPLPYPDPGRLVEITETNGGGINSVSYPNYLDWRKQADVFANMAASMVYDATLQNAGSAERVPVGYVSSEFFRVFRTNPLIGRDFTAADDTAGAPRTAIVTHRLWQTQFGSDPAAVGKPVSIDGEDYTLIGVLPPGFRFHREASVFVPISGAVIKRVLYLRENHNNMYVEARLRDGVAVEAAQARMSAIAGALAKEYPASNTNIGARVFPLRERVAGDSRRPLMMLLGAVALVLLIACVNVANLLLARAADRKKEMAVRAALGASRWQVLGQLLAESVLLAAAGGALGVLLARWSFAGLVKLVPASIAAGGLGLDLRVLGFTLLVSLLTGLLFGLAPVFDALRLNLNDAMRDGTRTTGASSRGRLRDGLVVSEIALALVLLVGAGLLVRTLDGLMKVRLGFEASNLLTARVSLPDNESVTQEQGVAFFERLSEQLRTMPGVKSAGAISHMPLSGFFSNTIIYRDDRPIPPREKMWAADQRCASPEYFRTMGIPLLKGRLFSAADGLITNFPRKDLMEWFRKSRLAVLINDTMARRYWPNEDPIGRTFRPGFPQMQGPPLTIVGVVGDTRDYGPGQEAPPIYYFSSYQSPFAAFTMVVKTSGSPTALVAPLRRAASGLDSSAVVSNVATAEEMVANSVAERRLNLQLLSIFAGIALVLATVGIYGVMAYSVNRRAHEVGIRMAMGAGGGDILRMVIGRAALLGGAGVVLGSLAALWLTRLISGMLYGVEPSDPATFGAVALLLIAVALAAAWAPARRAARVSPLTALRCE